MFPYYAPPPEEPSDDPPEGPSGSATAEGPPDQLDRPADPSLPTRAELRAFVGPRAWYYVPLWERAAPGQVGGIGFNWWVVFVGIAWFGYRRLYGVAAVVAAVVLAEAVVEAVVFNVALGQDPPVLLTVAIVVSIYAVCGHRANGWYLAKARRAIAEVRSLGLPEDEHLREVRRRGGVSVLGILVALSAYAAMCTASWLVIASLALVVAGAFR